ncbi:hypothetical protein WMY93_023428 [Mugilogobius chulae]|uniref:RanBP2-type domain-containing protein n=1 Tax=Mugilogobius chulae TaxID=88201 RepID=A0AAW0NFB5_9GOBI
MPLRPAAGKHEPPSPPRQEQQRHAHPYTHAANGSQGGSSDSSREEDSAIPFPIAGVGFRPGAERSRAAPMEEPTGNTVVIRIGIPDLQQTKWFLKLRCVQCTWERERKDCPIC